MRLRRQAELLPGKASNKRRDAFKQVRLVIGASRVSLTDWDGNVIDGALVDGTFPDYERVIPRGEPQHGTVMVAREPFSRAVAAVTAFAGASDTKRPALRFAFAGGHLTLSAVMDGCGSACRGSASAAIDVSATTMTESWTFSTRSRASMFGSTFSTWAVRITLPVTAPTAMPCT
jgi:hypothetical protein